uniref:Copper chaperone for superoxide dismutase n=1 Tax=Rhizophora mucronata TaxID=61149 RepID=A0A2P2KAP9_RHIMU
MEGLTYILHSIACATNKPFIGPTGCLIYQLLW